MSETRKATHIELIEPLEKLTGYLPPRKPATPHELLINAEAALEGFSALNMAVWKVARTSVNWKRAAAVRRLIVDGRTIPATVIGSVGHWWFVSVDAALVLERLTVR